MCRAALRTEPCPGPTPGPDTARTGLRSRVQPKEQQNVYDPGESETHPSPSLEQPSRSPLMVPLILLAVVTAVLVIAWAGLAGRAGAENTRRSFTVYDWTGSSSVGTPYDSPYPAGTSTGVRG